MSIESFLKNAFKRNVKNLTDEDVDEMVDSGHLQWVDENTLVGRARVVGEEDGLGFSPISSTQYFGAPGSLENSTGLARTKVTNKAEMRRADKAVKHMKEGKVTPEDEDFLGGVC